MQIVRTIVWVLILVALLIFSYFNWKPVEVQIWDNLVLETKVPALVVVSFLLGLVPMWLIHRGAVWRHRRRISALEANQRATVNAISTPTSAPPRPEPDTAVTRMATGGPLDGEPSPRAPHGQAPVPRDEILK